MESSFASFTALYSRISTFLTFSILQFFYEDPVYIQVGHENKLESSNSKRLNPAGGRLILALFNNDASTTETV